MKPPTITPGARFLLNALSAALVLRLFRLDDLSLWHDEGVTWWNATRPTWAGTLLAEPNNPPGWWLATRGWILAFGDSEASLRMPAVVLGVVSVFLAWRLARRLLDPAAVPARAGFAGLDAAAPLWIAALAAASAFWIEWSQEARMYSALLAESLGLSLLYLRWLDTGRRAPLVGYAVLAAVALHTHYFAVWPILSHAAHAAWTWWRARGSDRAIRLAPFAIAQAAAAVAFLPWFLYMLPRAWGAMRSPYDPFGWLAHALWRMGVGPAIVTLDRARATAGPAAAIREQPVLIAATAAAWFVPIAFGLRALGRDRGLRSFVLASLLVPVVATFAMGTRWLVLDAKYLIFLAPWLLLLAVLGAKTAPRLLRPVLLGGLVALHAAGLVAYHAGSLEPVEAALAGGHPYGKERWREVHAWVAGRSDSGTVVLLHAPYLHPVWDYYDAHAKAKAPALPVPSLDDPADRLYSAQELAAYAPALARAARVHLVVSHPETPEPTDWAKPLEDLGFSPTSFVREPTSWGIDVFSFARP